MTIQLPERRFELPPPERARLVKNLLRCWRKAGYPTRAKARKALRKWRNRGAHDIYPCRYCGMFHTGSRYRGDEEEAS